MTAKRAIGRVGGLVTILGLALAAARLCVPAVAEQSRTERDLRRAAADL